MWRDHALVRAASDVPPCLACGPWLPPDRFAQHRHVCMQDEGHDGPHRCVWHRGEEFEAEGFLDRETRP